MEHDRGDLEELKPQIRTLQIIVIALAMGVTIFGAVVIAMDRKPAEGQPLTSMVMALVGLGSLVARFVVPPFMAAQARRQIAEGTWSPTQNQSLVPKNDVGRLGAVYTTKTIVGAALLEGGAFANLIAFLLEGQWYSIIVAAGLLVGVLLSFPVSFMMTGWVKEQLRQVDEMRSLKRFE